MGSRRPRWVRRIMAAVLALCGVLALLYDSNRTVECTVLPVPVHQLPASFSGLRVAVVADLHGSAFGADSGILLRCVEQAQPDLIAICGDLFDQRTDRNMLEPLLKGLVAIAPVYYVTGNHEWTCTDLRQILARMQDWGVCVLANDYRVLERGGEKLVLAGVHDPNGPYDMKPPEQLLSQLRAEAGADACVLLLAHRNDRLTQWAQLGVNLVFCGHGHGGVVRLPVVGGLVAPGGRIPARYEAGLYTLGATRMAVSRGLGNTPGTVRLFNRPEVLLAVLQPAGENVNNP